MDLKTTQRLLAALYTDAVLIERWSVEPQVVAEEFGLGPEASRALANLSAAQVTGFARTLVRKRLSEMRRGLPRTCRVLGQRLEPVFAKHAATFHPQGVQRGLDDALAFARFLSGEREHAADLAHYEANWLLFRYGRTWPMLATFRSDPREVANGPGTDAHDKRSIVAVWFRFAGRVRHVVLRIPQLW